MANRKCEHDRRHSTCSLCSPESVYKMYAYKAVKRGLRFEIAVEQFLEIVQRPCVFCGESMEPRGVDRQDNRRGYVPENCQPCCGPCNALKGVRDQRTWLAGILKIAKYQEILQMQKEVTPPVSVQTTPGQPDSAVPSTQPRVQDPNISLGARRYLEGL